jgi:hypothetical protein
MGRWSFSISVRRAPRGGSGLLEEVAAWLRDQQETMACRVNSASFSMEAELCLSASPLDSKQGNGHRNTGGDEQGKTCKRRKFDLGEKSRSGDAVMKAVREQTSRAGFPKPEESMENLLSSGNGDKFSESLLEQCTLRVTVLQDSPGNFAVRGSIPASTSAHAAGHFSALAAKLQAQICSAVT